MKKNTGFTLIEVLVVLAIVGMLLVGVIFSYKKMQRAQALDRSVFLAVSTLTHARSLTLASKGSDVYGVRFEPTRMILFKGEVFQVDHPDNVVVLIHSLVRISGIALRSSDEVIYERLSGAVQNSGSVTFSMVNDLSEFKVVNIYESGLAEAN
jgi:prepilin-type N-terminal cleavage/methylation domain-containing protein